MKTTLIRSLLAPFLILAFVAQATFADPGKVIMGSTKEQVDLLLTNCPSRKSNRATASRPIYYYTKDVEVIVSFSEGRALGVAVIDRPGAGVLGGSESRYQDLLKLIGGGLPKPGDLKRDSHGIREFSIGDAD